MNTKSLQEFGCIVNKTKTKYEPTIVGKLYLTHIRPQADDKLDHTKGRPPSIELCTAGHLVGQLFSNMGISPLRPQWVHFEGGQGEMLGGEGWMEASPCTPWMAGGNRPLRSVADPSRWSRRGRGDKGLSRSTTPL